MPIARYIRCLEPATAAPQAAARACARTNAAELDDDASHERFAALLLLVCDAPALCLPGAQPQERVQLVLLPAVSHPPAYCTQHLVVQAAEGQLPACPASLNSLQAPFLTLRYCSAACGLAAAAGWAGAGCGGLFVLDSETTSLGGRDYIHQLAILNLRSCQLLTVLLRACPCSIGHTAAQVCGTKNLALHDPYRPTFGQLAPLLYAFIAAGSGSTGNSNNGMERAPPTIVAHNGGFDARMLIREWGRRNLPVPCNWRLLDTLPLACACVKDCSNHKQGTLRARFGVSLAPGEAEHDAGTDVTVLAQLLPFLVQGPGVGPLPSIWEQGLLMKKNGEGHPCTFGDVQVRMRGAPATAEAVTFTCGFCHARVVA